MYIGGINIEKVSFSAAPVHTLRVHTYISNMKIYSMVRQCDEKKITFFSFFHFVNAIGMFFFV